MSRFTVSYQHNIFIAEFFHMFCNRLAPAPVSVLIVLNLPVLKAFSSTMKSIISCSECSDCWFISCLTDKDQTAKEFSECTYHPVKTLIIGITGNDWKTNANTHECFLEEGRYSKNKRITQGRYYHSNHTRFLFYGKTAPFTSGGLKSPSDG